MQEQELDMSDDRLDNFITGTDYQPLDVIGEGAYGIVWCVLTFFASFIHPLIVHLQLSGPYSIGQKGSHKAYIAL